MAALWGSGLHYAGENTSLTIRPLAAATRTIAYSRCASAIATLLPQLVVCSTDDVGRLSRHSVDRWFPQLSLHVEVF